VCADSAEGSNERAGDLGIAVPLRHQVENPPFPRRRPGRPLWAALASPVGLLEVRPERWMSPSRRYLTPCGPKTRHRGRIGRWAGLTEPQFFGMAGPASSVRPSSSSPTSARRSRSVRDAEEDTEFSRYKSRRPNRTSPTIPPSVPGEIRLSANGRSIGGRQDWISAAVGGTCRCEERRGSSAHPRGAVRHRRVKGQRKGRVLYTHPYLLDRLDRLLPSASRTCSRQRGGPSSSGGSRWPPRPIPGRTSGCGAISWRSSLRTVGRRAVASCQPDGAPALRTFGRH